MVQFLLFSNKQLTPALLILILTTVGKTVKQFSNLTPTKSHIYYLESVAYNPTKITLIFGD